MYLRRLQWSEVSHTADVVTFKAAVGVFGGCLGSGYDSRGSFYDEVDADVTTSEVLEPKKGAETPTLFGSTRLARMLTNHRSTKLQLRRNALASTVMKINRYAMVNHRSLGGSNMSVLSDFYLGRATNLATGMFGSVHLGTNKATKEVRCIKSAYFIDNQKFKYCPMRECEMMLNFDHPNIVKIYESFYDSRIKTKKCIHIVMEYCRGGDLLSLHVPNHEPNCTMLPEAYLARIMKQILQAVVYLHRRNIVHKDIKLDNIMLDATGTNAKLIDFGLSEQLVYDYGTDRVGGTVHYMPPEAIDQGGLFKQGLSLKIDIWSLGVVMFKLIVGKYPYGADHTDVKYGDLLYVKTPVPSLAGTTSEELSDLVKKMLVIDPNERLSAEECLKHPWFNIVTDDAVAVDEEKQLVNNMMNFSKRSQLYAAFSNIVVHELDIDNNDMIVKLFKKIDTNGDGEITSEELDNYLIKIHGWAKQDVDRFLRIADVDDDGYLEISEFMSACRVWNANRDVAAIMAAFCNLDRSDKDTIGVEEVAKVAIVGQGVGTEHDIKKLMKMVTGSDREGRIGKEAFLDYLLST